MYEDIKPLIKDEYENGTSMSILSEKYKVKVNTIKTWSAKEKWVKKKQNKTTKKRTTKTKQPKKMVVKNKDAEILKDIASGMPKKEVLQKNSVSERTYYNKLKSIRHILIEQSNNVLKSITEKKYKNVEEQILEIEEKKEKLKNKFLNAKVIDKDLTSQILNELSLRREFEKEIHKGARIINVYRQAEFEQQIENENIQREKLEIERDKNSENKESETERVVIIDDTDKD